MKRLLCIFLSLLLLITLSSCSTSGTAKTNSVTFYYRTNEISHGGNDGVIIANTRKTEIDSTDYTNLIKEYLTGPTSYDCISPFPAGISLVELNIRKNNVQIEVSAHLAVLSGAELSVACACLTKTIFEHTGITTVQISATDSLLNNKTSLTFNTLNIELQDVAGID